MPRTHPDTTVSARDARALLLRGAGLLDRPDRAATPRAVLAQVQRLGFVQVDTIQVIDRAHHRILHTRFDGYRPATLTRLLEHDRALFEHWTHDASVIPTRWYRMWSHRFGRVRRTPSREAAWQKRIGPDAPRVLADVLKRLEKQGPMSSADFETPPGRKPGTWWDWKPAKTALEYHWRTGRVAVTRREGFQKVYDLAERVFPDVHPHDPPRDDEHTDWACSEALDRLGVATAAELAGFFAAVPIADARAWIAHALDTGRAVPVRVASVDGKPPRPAVAHPQWRARARNTPPPPDRLRLLSPFDPAIRDRARVARLFGFHYRFGAFTPAAKRPFGYYDLPILEGDRLVGRLDPKLHRDRAELDIRGLWWEPGIKPTKPRRAALDDALQRLAHHLDATTITLPPPRA